MGATRAAEAIHGWASAAAAAPAAAAPAKAATQPQAEALVEVEEEDEFGDRVVRKRAAPPLEAARV